MTSLAHAVGGDAIAAKLPCLGSKLNASKLESVLEFVDLLVFLGDLVNVLG